MKKFIPETKRECDMDGSESGNDVIFSCAHIAFGEVGAVVVGGDELNNTGRCGGAE